MNGFKLVRGFLERAGTDSPSPDLLAAEFVKATEALGFRYLACCSHVDPFRPPGDAVMVHNYPRGWVRTFSEGRLYRIDPVLQRARTSPVPFFWDTAFRSGTLSRPQKHVLADAARYGLIHGYTIPLQLSWLPGTLRASCSVIPDEGIDEESYLALEALANSFYFFTLRATAPWLSPPRMALTRRQLECLALVAQGKNDRIIARLLRLGECTAHYHVEHGKRRLGVSTRPQAIAQALLTGQLTFAELARERTRPGRPR